MRKLSLRSVVLALAAPLAALVIASLISSIILVITGHNPVDAASAMWNALGRRRIQVAHDQLRGFLLPRRRGGGHRLQDEPAQHRGGRSVQAGRDALGGRWPAPPGCRTCPTFVRVGMTILAAMLVGAAWAGIAVFLKVTRGVSEVISTIMLNSIAIAIIAYLLSPGRLAVANGNNIGTRPITDDGMVPTIPVTGSITPLYTLTIIAVIIGIGYALLLNRTVFGFSLRATGLNPAAAIASGISAKRIAVYTMLISGAVAGLVGIPELLNGPAQQYSVNFPTGFGIHRHRHRPARTQQPDRHGVRRPAVVGAGQLGELAAGRGNPQPAGRDHAGGHRAERGHRLRAGPAVPDRARATEVAKALSVRIPEAVAA